MYIVSQIHWIVSPYFYSMETTQPLEDLVYSFFRRSQMFRLTFPFHNLAHDLRWLGT